MSQAAVQPPGNRTLRILLGLGLMLPAGLCCLIGMVIPTISTFVTSFQNKRPLGDSVEFIGWENFERLFSDVRFGHSMSFTLTMIGVRLLIVAILPLLLALGVNAFGRAVRIPVRLIFTIPLALYTPVAFALSWRLALMRVPAEITQGPLLRAPETARAAFLLTDGLFVLGLAAGLGLIFYLAALRGSGEEAPTFRQVRKPLILTWVIGLLATIALTLQDFDWSYLLTGGGPAGSTTTLALYQLETGLQKLQFGLGAAAAVPSLLIMLVLGLITGLIVVLASLRLEVVPHAKPSPDGSKTIFGVILALALLCSVAACGLNATAIPAGVLSGLDTPGRGRDLTGMFPLGRVLLVNTMILPTLFVLLFQIPLTYLAALGIGGLRPLGKRSEWLLLLFSPWLFVTAGPLLIALYEQLRSIGLINTAVATAGPFWLSIPILFVLTLFFRGREKPYQEAVAGGQSPLSAFFSKVIAPSLPLALLLALAAILVRMQRFEWPLITAHKPDLATMPVILARIVALFGIVSPTNAGQLAIFVIPISLFFLIAFGIFQAVYMDRLALCYAEPHETPPVEEQPTAEPAEDSPKPKSREKSPKAAPVEESPKPKSRRKSAEAEPAEDSLKPKSRKKSPKAEPPAG